MRILVVSDTHYKTERLEDLVENLKEKIDVVIHLGDAAEDASFIKKNYGIATYSVSGNCDRKKIAEKEKIIEVAGKKIFLTHGHFYGVNSNPDIVIKYAKRKGVDICLFGHTHMPFLQLNSGFFVLNPGSLSEPRNGSEPSYGILKIEDNHVYPMIVPYI